MLFAIIAASLIALLSLVGALVFATLKKSPSELIILPLAVGVFLSVVLFELIPEATDNSGYWGSAAIAVGFLSFYLLSHLLRTFHHHESEPLPSPTPHRTGHLILFGDAVHNFADGIVIASAFLINPAVGVATTLGIALHEIPQEIAEYGILLKSGYSKLKAAWLNFLSSTSVVVGVLVTFLFVDFSAELLPLLIGFAAGNLLYIAASDLLPHFHHHTNENQSFWRVFLTATLGLVLMSTLLVLAHEHDEEEEDHTSVVVTTPLT